MRPYGKYGARRTKVGDLTFDSAQEARRWKELTALQAKGHIRGLRRQVKYELIPTQKAEWKGDRTERPVAYVADFVYTVASTGMEVVEDSKGMRTPDYVIKRKLMRYMHGIRILETGARRRKSETGELV